MGQVSGHVGGLWNTCLWRSSESWAGDTDSRVTVMWVELTFCDWVSSTWVILLKVKGHVQVGREERKEVCGED